MAIRLDPTTVLTATGYSASVAHNTADGTSHSAVLDNTVKSVHVALDLLNVASEITAALSGSVSKKFKPTRAIVRVTAQTGAGATGDSHIQIGTSASGTQILASTHLTGLQTVGQCFIINLAGIFADIAGNANIFVKTAVVDTTGTTMAATVTLEGTEA